MAERDSNKLVGRGAAVNPPNRFEPTQLEDDFDQLPADDDLLERRRLATVYLPDASQRIICENDSPDVGFRFSINPYRGCEHGCVYCYARPTHELLGMNAGVDFEAKIVIKHDAPELLRRELAEPSWKPETIAISGVTDCYQRAERQFRLTRGCLEVMLESGQPCGIISKNVLMLRDIDLLREMARRNLVRVFLSITTLRAELARSMEPRTATPAAKLHAMRELADEGVPVGLMVAPVIPGLTDCEIPAILQAAREHGARTAGYVLLRLPGAVWPVFEDWLARCCPLEAPRVLSLIRSTRAGGVYQNEWGLRMRGQGPYAEQIGQTFGVFAHKYGLDEPLDPLDTSQFRPPVPRGGQRQLF